MKNQDQQPEIEIFIGKQRKSPAFLQAIWLKTRHAVNHIAAAELTLRAPDASMARLKEQSSDLELCAPGAEIEIRLVKGEVLFAGLIVEQNIDITRERAQVDLRLRHNLMRLGVSHRSQLFENMADAEIARAMLSEHKVLPGKIEGMMVRHPQLVQYNCSDWQFLKSRLGANNAWLIPTNLGVDIVSPKLAPMADIVVNADTALPVAGAGKVADAEQAVWNIGVAHQPHEIELSAWDISRQEQTRPVRASAPPTGKGAFDASRLEALTSESWNLLYSSPLAADEQTALAGAQLCAQHMRAARGSFTLLGDAGYKLGQTLQIKGFGSALDGSGIVTGVIHHISQGRWRTVVQLGHDGLTDVDAAPLPTISGLHVGIVDQYQADPLRLNRLRVQLPVLKLPVGALWARLATPYASKDSGLCLYPEPGDEVVVSFFENDPRYPVILGSMHNPKNAAPFAPSIDNAQKGLVLQKNGKRQQWLFDAKTAQFSIELDQDAMRIGKDGIACDTPKKLLLNAGEFTVAAKQKVTLEGKAGVKIKGATIDLEK